MGLLQSALLQPEYEWAADSAFWQGWARSGQAQGEAGALRVLQLLFPAFRVAAASDSLALPVRCSAEALVEYGSHSIRWPCKHHARSRKCLPQTCPNRSIRRLRHSAYLHNQLPE